MAGNANIPESRQVEPASTPPILNYAPPDKKRSSALVRSLLLAEILLLLLGLVILDGGFVLGIVAVTSLVCWTVVALALELRKRRLTWTDRICILAGYCAAVAVVVLER